MAIPPQFPAPTLKNAEQNRTKWLSMRYRLLFLRKKCMYKVWMRRHGKMMRTTSGLCRVANNETMTICRRFEIKTFIAIRFLIHATTVIKLFIIIFVIIIAFLLEKSVFCEMGTMKRNIQSVSASHHLHHETVLPNFKQSALVWLPHPNSHYRESTVLRAPCTALIVSRARYQRFTLYYAGLAMPCHAMPCRAMPYVLLPPDLYALQVEPFYFN